MSSSNKIGFWAIFAIVTGSQIGAAIFTLPVNLAPYGVYGLFGCLISGCGAMALGFVFAELCNRLPYTGGPHVYVRHAFGSTLGFFTGWTYWVISWVSTTIVIIACIGYLSPLLANLPAIHPIFSNNIKECYLFLEIILLVSITWLNLRGIKFAGNAEFFLTLLKFIPLIILPMVALCYFDKQNFIITQQATKLSSSTMLGKVTLLSLWGFIGLETATTPADSVLNPKVTIPRAIILGTLSVAMLYLLNFVGMMGLFGTKLIYSNAPYVDAAREMFGGNWYLLISIIATIVCVGTLNAWVLTSGQIALGLAQDNLMPKLFGQKNNHDAPVWGLIISSSGIIPLLFFTYTQSLSTQIAIIVDVSVIAFLFVYLICCLSFLRLLFKENNRSIIKYFIVITALIFCVWIMYETPINTLLLSSIFILSGIPLYLLWYRRRVKQD